MKQSVQVTPDSPASLSRVVRPVGSRGPQEQDFAPLVWLLIQAPTKLTESCGRLARHSRKIATGKHAARAPPELDPPVARRAGFRPRSLVGFAASLATKHRASESAGPARSAPRVAGAVALR